MFQYSKKREKSKEHENPSSAELATSTKCEVPRAGFSCVSYNRKTH